MLNYHIYEILLHCHVFTPVAVSVALLVIGCIVLAGSVKQTRILGLSIILPVAGSVLSLIYNIGMRYNLPEAIYKLSPYAAILSISGTVAGAFFLCLYIHKNYGKKFYYIPLLLTPIIEMIAVRITMPLLYKADLSGVNSSALYPLTTTILGMVGVIISDIFIIIAFYKNSDKEKIIPKAWVARLIMFICSMLYSSFLIVFYSLQLVDPDHIRFMTTMVFHIVTIMNSLSTLIFPIYLLTSVRKASYHTEIE